MFQKNDHLTLDLLVESWWDQMCIFYGFVINILNKVEIVSFILLEERGGVSFIQKELSKFIGKIIHTIK